MDVPFSPFQVGVEGLVAGRFTGGLEVRVIAGWKPAAQYPWCNGCSIIVVENRRSKISLAKSLKYNLCSKIVAAKSV